MSFLFPCLLLSVVYPVLFHPLQARMTAPASFCAARTQKCTILRGCNALLFNKVLPLGICFQGTAKIIDMLDNDDPGYPSIGVIFKKIDSITDGRKKCNCTKCDGPCGNYDFNSMNSDETGSTSTIEPMNLQLLNSSNSSSSQTADVCVFLSHGSMSFSAKFCNFRSNRRKRGAPVCVQGEPVSIEVGKDPEFIIAFKHNVVRRKVSGPKEECDCSVCNSPKSIVNIFDLFTKFLS